MHGAAQRLIPERRSLESYCRRGVAMIMLSAMKEAGLPDDAADVTDFEGLVSQARAGDESAFETLYRATVGSVYGVCLRMTAEQSAAEECTQRAYVKAWQGLADFRGDAKITTWLHRIAVNEVLGLGRRERRQLRRQHHPMDEVDELMPVEVSDPGRTMDLERAIAALPERARQVFVLCGIYGYAHHDTAAMLGIAVGTSKAHFHRARELLRNTLDPRDE